MFTHGQPSLGCLLPCALAKEGVCLEAPLQDFVPTTEVSILSSLTCMSWPMQKMSKPWGGGGCESEGRLC